ncbi:MAG: 2-dehydropantoate 2-reductase [Candidatus Heimdallarchaeota archaeon]|nr:2-dehydropantoate 2-reductase [Candidatus Heimdallarchaeota archaeon]
MSIAIYGAGSIGSLFAGRMAYTGHNISVIGRTPHIDEINKFGLRIIENGNEFISHFPAKADFQPEVISPEAVLVTTKAYDNKNVAKTLKGQISPEVPIFIIQNGIGNENAFKQSLPENSIFRAITTEAAELIHPGIVKHVAFGKTTFGIIAGKENGFGSLIQSMLRKSGFDTKRTQSMEVKIWHKLLTNATICPLGALLHVPNGRILEKSSIGKIFDAILQEGLAVAKYHLPDEDLSTTKDFILQVIEKTKDNKCSMLQDIERGRRTEIDYLNGYIADESQRLGLKAPVNSAIADLVRHLERYPLK